MDLDPTLRFPVLLHWSFTSYGEETFRTLVEGLDSGLLGTLPDPADPADPSASAGGPPTGRVPVEIVETGHVGLAHRTRLGDEVRSWYRGPFVPNPATDPPGGRLPLAHAADQLRIVVPDGREDISLAAAFEVGRLLALARPSMVAALMRWRQGGYQAARRGAVWSDHVSFLTEVLGAEWKLDGQLGVLLGRGLADAAVARPADFVGNPAPPVVPGRPLPVDGTVADLLGKGFGLPPDALTGTAADVLGKLRATDVLHPVSGRLSAADPRVRTLLSRTVRREVDRLVADTLAAERAGPDALDRLLAGTSDGEPSEDGVTDDEQEVGR